MLYFRLQHVFVFLQSLARGPRLYFTSTLLFCSSKKYDTSKNKCTDILHETKMQAELLPNHARAAGMSFLLSVCTLSNMAVSSSWPYLQVYIYIDI